MATSNGRVDGMIPVLHDFCSKIVKAVKTSYSLNAESVYLFVTIITLSRIYFAQSPPIRELPSQVS